MTYESLIESFVYSEFPSMLVSPAARFEAVAAEVFGTKQRRFGPMPTPEDQVAVRSVIRMALDKNEALTFFLPWGSSKQDGSPLDILELMAMKQLVCLSNGLASMGVKSHFVFRVEDLTDRYLFGDSRLGEITKYAEDFSRMVKAVLPSASIAPQVLLESMATERDFKAFSRHAESYVGKFYAYLTGKANLAPLQAIGWCGRIPQEQREYYLNQYAKFNNLVGKDHVWEMAKYFAATLARVNLRATMAPDWAHIHIAFTHPVPGNPISKPRLYYRTLPARFTHQHKSPWLARGYLRIGADNAIEARFLERDDQAFVVDHVVDFHGVKISAPYLF